MARRMPGTARVQNVTLKRGFVASTDAFMNAVDAGPLPAVMPERGCPSDADAAITEALALPFEPGAVASGPSAERFDYG